MSWPQIVMLAWLLFSAGVGIKREVFNRNQTPGWATAGVFFILLVTGGMVALLHVGGFW